MKKKSIFSQFFTAFLIIIVMSIGASAIYSTSSFELFVYKTEADELIEKTELLKALFNPDELYSAEQLNSFARAGNDRFTRITIVDKTGIVLADSIEDVSLMNNHRDRPEVSVALKGFVNTKKRFSETLSREMMYAAVPVYRGQEIVGVIRTSVSIGQIQNKTRVIYLTTFFISLVIVLISAGICYMMAFKFSSAINSIKSVAGYFARGDFSFTLVEDGNRETIALSKSINEMGDLLQKRFNTISKQKNRFKSMLHSMVEPVIRLDKFFFVEEMNEAAEKLFNRERVEVKGLSLLELTRNTALYDFAEKTIRSKQVQECTLSFGQDPVVSLQIHGSPLLDADKKKVGVLLVMNDITRLIQLQNMRKDFVANVSHELKTPVTAIQGYVETLKNNEVEGPQLEKFLDIIHKHTIRVNAIIEDLLSLAELEKNEETLEKESFPAIDLISSTVQAVSYRAEKSGVPLEVTCDEDILLHAHPLLADQALSNLVFNAVKYSEPGSPVSISAEKTEQGVTLFVKDRGCGIPEQEQSRIFERFYRVDKARSRDLGGTGLGLSIVKHIAQVHGGSAGVISAPGEGATFFITFPE